MRERQAAVAALLDGGLTGALREALGACGDMERVVSRVALQSATPRDLTRLQAAPRDTRRPGADRRHRHPPMDRAGRRHARPVEHARPAPRAIVERRLRPFATASHRPRLQRATRRTAQRHRKRRPVAARPGTRRRGRTGIATLKVGLQPRARLLHRGLPRRRRFGTGRVHPAADHEEHRALHQARTEDLRRQRPDQPRPGPAAREDTLRGPAGTARQRRSRTRPRRARRGGNPTCSPASPSGRRPWASPRPRSLPEPGLSITQGWHPVVREASAEAFVPNDLDMARQAPHADRHRAQPWAASPPTCARPPSSCCSAFAGSFVPAAAAEIGPVDRIFTRIAPPTTWPEAVRPSWWR